MAPGYSVRMQGQTRNLDETTDNLVMAIALASVFVYMVLAAQFESFVQPLIIMTVLPLSVPFALFTIWVTGRTLNLWSALGILLLFGIVKKNSILQVDYTNVLRAQGMPLEQALVEACRTRLRPILMTTLGDHRRPDSDRARSRDRRRPALGDCRHDHRRSVALSLPDAPARAGRLCEARRARAIAGEPAAQSVVRQASLVDGRPAAPRGARRTLSAYRRCGDVFFILARRSSMNAATDGFSVAFAASAAATANERA